MNDGPVGLAQSVVTGRGAHGLANGTRRRGFGVARGSRRRRRCLDAMPRQGRLQLPTAVGVHQTVQNRRGKEHAVTDLHAAPLRDVPHDVVFVLSRRGWGYGPATWKVGKLGHAGQLGIGRVDQDGAVIVGGGVVAGAASCQRAKIQHEACGGPYFNGRRRRCCRCWTANDLPMDKARCNFGKIERFRRHVWLLLAPSVVVECFLTRS